MKHAPFSNLTLFAVDKSETKTSAYFRYWWNKEMGSRMKGSRYLARNAWNAAIALAAEQIVPGGDREAIKALKDDDGKMP